MILLISSDASRRYSDDIVRALAHPIGTEFQFRYDLAYFDPSLKPKATSNKLAGETAMIAFLAADAAAQTVELTSVRAVTVKRSEIVGSSCIMTLVAGDYLHPLDDAAIRVALSRPELALLPAWTGELRPTGHFAINVVKTIHAGHVPKPGEQMKAFEETAIALSAFLPFAPSTGMAFYAVRGLTVENPPAKYFWQRDPTPALDGQLYKLQSGFRYRFDVYTYRTAGSAVAPATKLSISTDEKAVQFTSAKEAVLDSRYDLNRFSFTTDEMLYAVPAVFHVTLGITASTPPLATEQRCDITLLAQFAGWRRKVVGRTLIVAAGTASSAIIGIVFKDKFGFWVGAMMCVGPLIAAATSTIPTLKKNN